MFHISSIFNVAFRKCPSVSKMDSLVGYTWFRLWCESTLK